MNMLLVLVTYQAMLFNPVPERQKSCRQKPLPELALLLCTDLRRAKAGLQPRLGSLLWLPVGPGSALEVQLWYRHRDCVVPADKQRSFPDGPSNENLKLKPQPIFDLVTMM